MTPLILAFWFVTQSPYAEIRVVDEAGRGVPLVELETVNRQIFVTDNAGRVAFLEPGLMDREVWFHVRSHGYEAKTDGFGMSGVKVIPSAGKIATITVKHMMIAERLCRLTGEGLYRDSELLGYRVPKQSNIAIGGQDSVQVARYRDQYYWFWGDTNRLNYPLGMYRTAGAKTSVFNEVLHPDRGIAYEYFTDKNQFAKPMMPLPERPEGVIWLDGVCTVTDDVDTKRLVAHYSRRKGLAQQLEHGIAVFNDDSACFEPVKELIETDWRHPHGHVVKMKDGDQSMIHFGNPVANVRVPATLKAILDRKQYEAFNFVAVSNDPKRMRRFTWSKDHSPITSQQEAEEQRRKVFEPQESRYHPVNADDDAERVTLHNGTVHWNAYRKCYVMLAGQIGGKTSHLGEVWYAEALEPTGPFTKAVKVVTHNKQTFYNVCHHPFLDKDDGRTIYFEGTYTEEFSGSRHFTPRYDYNQVLYKLVLSSPDLLPARVR